MMKFMATIAVLATSAEARDKCCDVCDSSMIKCYSVDHLFNMCGESCMLEKDYWKYKIFEPGMHKAESDHPCHDLGFTNYRETETHSVPHVISIDVDLFRKPQNIMEVNLTE